MFIFSVAPVLLATVSWIGVRPPPPEPSAPAPPPAREQAAPPKTDDADVAAARRRRWATEALSSDGTFIYRAGLALDPLSLYGFTGRPDLAEQLVRRTAAKRLGVGVGVAASVVGVVLGLGDAAATSAANGLDHLWAGCGTGSLGPECQDHHHASPLPWMIAVTGGVTAIVASVVPADPLTPAEKQSLLREHNLRLWNTIVKSTGVGAAVLPDGRSGMLVAGGRF